jgi:hypothetical protein
MIPKDAEILRKMDAKELEICQKLAVFGSDYLRHDLKWTAEAAKDFLDRRDVQREVRTLQERFKDRDGIQARLQFFAQVKINMMVPAALGILAQALAGDRRDENGQVTNLAPGKAQYEAAIEVLDRANVQGTKFPNGGGNMPSVDARQVHIHEAGSDPAASLTPQKRTAVGRLAKQLITRIKADAEAKRRVEERAPAPAEEARTVDAVQDTPDIDDPRSE